MASLPPNFAIDATHADASASSRAQSIAQQPSSNDSHAYRDRYASTDDHHPESHDDAHLDANHLHHLHVLQPRPILKSERNLSRSAAHLRWDEDTIRLHDTERGTRMKIDEPKTPWTRADHSLEQVNSPESGGGGIPPLDLMDAMDLDPKDTVPSVVKDREQEAAPAAAKDEWSDDDEDEDEHLGEDALEHKRQFEKMRAEHYNMKEALQRARWLAEHEEEEEEDDDDDQADDSDAEIAIRVPPVPPVPTQFTSSSSSESH